jgi:hypothetical protein
VPVWQFNLYLRMCALANDKGDRLAEWELPHDQQSGEIVLVSTERPLGEQSQRAFSTAPPLHLRSIAPKAQARPGTSLADSLGIDALKRHGVPMLLASMGRGSGGGVVAGGAAGGKGASVGAVSFGRPPR